MTDAVFLLLLGGYGLVLCIAFYIGYYWERLFK